MDFLYKSWWGQVSTFWLRAIDWHYNNWIIMIVFVSFGTRNNNPPKRLIYTNDHVCCFGKKLTESIASQNHWSAQQGGSWLHPQASNLSGIQLESWWNGSYGGKSCYLRGLAVAEGVAGLSYRWWTSSRNELESGSLGLNTPTRLLRGNTSKCVSVWVRYHIQKDRHTHTWKP